MFEIFKKTKWFLFSFFLFICFLIFISLKEDDEIVVDSFNDFSIEKEEEIYVDIKGAIQKPGVYSVKENSRVKDVIEKAGGLTKYADTSVLNLSKQVQDEMVIIIYTESEILEMKKGTTSIKFIEKECICPKLENDACIEDVITNKEDNNISKISLNSATKEQLMTLPGIGSSKADAIIKYRETNGFQTIEDLLNVKGIGKSTFEKLKEFIML